MKRKEIVSVEKNSYIPTRKEQIRFLLSFDGGKLSNEELKEISAKLIRLHTTVKKGDTLDLTYNLDINYLCSFK